MGAHLAIATVPACKLTANRTKQLHRLIAKLPRSDLEELIEVRCLEDGEESDEVICEEARELLRLELDWLIPPYRPPGDGADRRIAAWSADGPPDTSPTRNLGSGVI